MDNSEKLKALDAALAHIGNNTARLCHETAVAGLPWMWRQFQPVR